MKYSTTGKGRRSTVKMLALLFFLGQSKAASAQEVTDQPLLNPGIATKTWDAIWVTHPEAELNAHGVFYFRRVFELTAAPKNFIVHVSADNRYELYVNGERVALGPAWGDLHHWRFESLDIAPYLKAGQNIIAAQVVNFGHSRAVSQFSHKTAFILQGSSAREAFLNTGADGWQVLLNPAYRPNVIGWDIIPSYYAANPTDEFRAAAHPWQWREIGNKYPWLPTRQVKVANGTPRASGHYFSDQSPWFLVPRNIPLLEETRQDFAEVERTENVSVSPAFLRGKDKVRIPPHTKATILLDHKVHTRGFPEFYFSGGKNATIKVKYAEALFDKNRHKGNRDVVAGKEMKGYYYDLIRPDGAAGRSFRPLWHRVFRYLELEITTEDAPLTLDSLHHVFTAYPYQRKAHFATDDSLHGQLFGMGWRTLRNGTAEVFEDGPYYEQLMYAGDARIASLVSLYLSGDERMTRNAIDLFDNSRLPDGLTLSRYPSHLAQINPQYSLVWVQTVHDYLKYSADTAFARPYLDGIAGVLRWHTRLLDGSGMLGEVPWLRHIENKSGTPRHPERGHSAQQSLFLALTLDMAADIFRFYGQEKQGDEYRQQARQIKEATYRLCWDENKNLLGDTPERDVFTQHANVLGILTDAIPPTDQREVMRKVLSDPSLVQGHMFFHFWIFQALDKSGLGNEFLNNIDFWRSLPGQGFTTFPEFDLESRSDCHPWSTHVNYFFLHTVAGVRPGDGFGFNRVVVKPHLGGRKYVEARVPHPRGMVSVKVDVRQSTGHHAEIVLPEGLSGSFEWDGKKQALHPGKQRVVLD